MKQNNLWAPWRMEYLKTLDPASSSSVAEGGCFLCRYWEHPEADEEQLVLWRSERCMVLFNRFPYTGGHLLVAPAAHVGDLHGLDEATMLEMMCLTRQSQTVLQRAIKPHGFNVGVNIGRCAGAGLPDHVHMHVVPRWEGDTNSMSTIGNVRLISQSLDELYGQLVELSRELGLPTL